MLTTDLMKKVRQIEIGTRHLVTESFAGEYRSVFKGQGMEFDDVRPYSPGDDIRLIDWNVTARMGSLFIRRYREERELTVMLAVDASGSSDFGTVNRYKRELAAELGAVLSFAATQNNDNVGLLIFTDRIEMMMPPRKGKRHILRLIRDLLAFVPQSRGTDLRLAFNTINRIIKRHSVVFVISDFLADPEIYRSSLSITSQRHDVIAIDVSDPMERVIPKVGLMALKDAETDEVSWIDTDSRRWRDDFTGRVESMDNLKSRTFESLGVDYVKVSTDKDYVSDLTAFFRKRSKRRPR
ncbi:MAG: DUF58 domain-containing protein [Chloroflexi bacterium]|nr:DUF58 domain-containing protein [Chloroflexota bacterium]